MNGGSVLLLALAASADNICIGLALALQKKRIDPLKNLFISAITMAGTALPLLAGNYIRLQVGLTIMTQMGAILLITMGLIIIFKRNIYKGKDDPNQNNPGFPHSEKLSWSGACGLGIILSLNNIPIGLAAGIMGINVVVLALATFISSYVLLWAASSAAHLFPFAKDNVTIDFIAGFMVLIVGVLSLI